MSSIPSEVAEIHDLLSTEITWLHGRWICYRQLFGESQRRFDLLNECASTFFFIVQDVLLGEVQVMLSKLTDPAKTGKHDNLTLELLQVRLDAYGDKDLAARNRTRLDALQTMCAPFRTWRNKQLAHLDLHTSKKATPDPLPGISRQMIEDALAEVRQYMNAIELHYGDCEQGYEHFAMSSDGEALLSVLRAGLRYEELVQAQRISYDDYRRGAWSDA